MLKDYLLDWCDREYDDSCAGRCGAQCDNAENCEHDCNVCLDQVHWFQERKGRRDYDCPLLLMQYVLRFTGKYSAQIRSALEHVDLARYPEYNIFSIGCGGAPDLMAFEEIAGEKRICYKGYDRNPLWEEIHGQIEQYAKNTSNLRARLRQKDIFDVLSSGRPQHRRYNIVIIQYLLSHLYNTGQSGRIQKLFDYIIEDLLADRHKNRPFLIILADIDYWGKGRNTWYTFLDKLEEAGYYGTAYAHSAYPAGDLGEERWSNHKSSPVFNNIEYIYYKNSSVQDGAQLIIELEEDTEW